MKHILYITTAMDEKDFKEYITHWKSAPNPSNQNFHNKLIRSLAINNKVDVLSLRPFSKSLCDMKKLEKEEKNDKNITWHYLAVSRSIFKKFVNCQTQINSLFKQLVNTDTIIFTDTINPALIHFLKHAVNKKYKNKIIGIVTDSPSNISNTGRSFSTYILNNASNYDGYLALTDELNELYNRHNKPSCILEGIVEKRTFENRMPLQCKYFFFAGALMERYGVYNLIEAFKQFLKQYPDYYLIIAGHHGDEHRLLNTIKDYPNIRYLKMLPVDDILFYEQHSIGNINPRPFSEDLDRYSIPSKTIEYLVSGSPTISVKNTKLAKIFLQEIIWARSDSPLDLKEALEKVATMSKETRHDIVLQGQKKALENYSFDVVNKLIQEKLFDVI